MLRRLRYFALLFVITFHARAQNLIPNPGFEMNKGCPTGDGQVALLCNDWMEYHSPDYFHSCNTGQWNVPSSKAGYQQAAGGNAYVGVYIFSTNFDKKEKIEARIPPLQTGATYEFSMFVSLGEWSRWATDNLGVFFYDKPGSNGVNNSTVPQISFSGYGSIADNVNWTQLTAKFTADSAYSSIVIGGFYDNSVVNRTDLGQASDGAYYYIDSVVLKQVSRMIVMDVDTASRCAGDTINVPYMASPNITFNTGNKFSLQLSDASGNFTAPTTIGWISSTTSGIIQGVIPTTTPGSGYKFRIVSSDPYYVSEGGAGNLEIKPMPAFTAGSNSPVCTGGELNFFLQHSYPMATYAWTGPGFSSTGKEPVILNTSSLNAGVYRITLVVNGCSASKVLPVNIDDIPSFDLGIDKSICNYDKLVIGISQEGLSYLWNTGASNRQILAPDPGTYVLTATNHCGSASDSIKVEIEQCDNCAFIPNAFTPNNDGLNDGIAPIIRCQISKYKFVVVNRYGEEVFRSTSPGEKWDGLYKGEPAGVGTYFYFVLLTGPRNREFLVKGDITLIR